MGYLLLEGILRSGGTGPPPAQPASRSTSRQPHGGCPDCLPARDRPARIENDSPDAPAQRTWPASRGCPESASDCALAHHPRDVRGPTAIRGGVGLLGGAPS